MKKTKIAKTSRQKINLIIRKAFDLELSNKLDKLTEKILRERYVNLSQKEKMTIAANRFDSELAYYSCCLEAKKLKMNAVPLKLCEKMETTCDECRRKFKDGVSCFNQSCGYFGESESWRKWDEIRYEKAEQDDLYAGKY